jgi:hypothetical protein
LKTFLVQGLALGSTSKNSHTLAVAQRF